MSDPTRGANEGASLEFEGVDWWHAYLRGAPEQLELPFDRGRPTALGTDRRSISVPIDSRTTGDDLLSAVVATLFRQTGEEDIVVGVDSVDGVRPVRVSIESTTTADVLRKAVSDGLAEVAAHGPPELDGLARALGSKTDPSHAPVVQFVVGSGRPGRSGFPSTSR